GLLRLGIASKTAAGRIGRAKWLGDAVAGGWLEGITIEWSDGAMARTVANWKGAVREVPLFVQPAQDIDDECLAIYLGVPRLLGLVLQGRACRNPSVLRLGQRADLRELRLGRMLPNEMFAPLFEQVGQLVGLRKLSINGGLQRFTDDDLKP